MEGAAGSYFAREKAMFLTSYVPHIICPGPLVASSQVRDVCLVSPNVKLKDQYLYHLQHCLD